MSGRGAADKAESLAGWKSPYRQLPVFRRLAYPVRAEATKHDRPGRKSPSCPAVVFAAVGTIRGASKLGGRNITKYLHPRKHAAARNRYSQMRRGKPTHILPWGRPMTPWKKQVQAHGVPPGYGVQHPRNDSQNNVGKLPWAAGTGYNLQGLSERGQKPKEERAQWERRMSQYERRRRGNALPGDGSRLPNGGNTRVGQRGSGHLAAFSDRMAAGLIKPAYTQVTV
jgi:hypothetical protein